MKTSRFWILLLLLTGCATKSEPAKSTSMKDANACCRRGEDYGESGQLNKAMAEFNKAIELNPKYGDAFNNLAKTYGRRGYYKQAILFYDRVIELNPKDADTYYNRGKAYDRLDDSRFANQDLKIAAKLGNIFAQKSLKEKGITW